jgi:hypothetical protein
MHMKKTGAILLFACMGLSAIAQKKADDIINKVIETMGGKEKLMSIKTIKKAGNGEAQGVKYPINFYAVHNRSERTDFSFNGLTGYQIITTDSGFNFNPFSGMSAPERMTVEDVNLSSDSRDLESPLVNYQAKGHTVELMDNEDIDGVDAIQLRMSLKNGKTIFFYIDPDTYYIIRTTAKGVSNGQEFSSTSNYYDFRKNKDGILFAYVVDNITYDNIEINLPMDDKLFSTKK